MCFSLNQSSFSLAAFDRSQIDTSPAEQSWFSRQSAQRAPSLHRFCPPRKFPMWQRESGTVLHLPATVYGLCLPQVGKIKRKFGPLPSQEVRLNPGQSRSERHSLEGGPRKIERAGEATTRVIKRARVRAISLACAQRDQQIGLT